MGNTTKLSDALIELVDRDSLSLYPRANPNSEVRELLQDAQQQSENSLYRLSVSGLWLLHGFLHESHEISQNDSSPEGSAWHAIMHRLERDFWNAKYWYRRAGQHPIYDLMSNQIDSIAGATDHFADGWDPELFVDVCEQAESDKQLLPMVSAVAQAEWQCLFEYCGGKV